MEMRSILGASKALEELTKLLPAFAHKVIKGNKTEDVETQSLIVGDKVLVKPGEKIPVDGVIVEGNSSVNEAVLTGESSLVNKSVSNSVIGGSINTDGALVVRISKIGEDTYLNQVIKLVQEAQNSQSKTQDLAGRAARWLTVIGVGGGLLTLGGWALLSNQGFAFAIERAVTVMVITCPHALGLAIPLVISVSTVQSAKEGLLIRDRVSFERAKDIDVVVFDKTGTITKGEPSVTDVIILDKNLDRKSILQLAGSLENQSEHPLAQAIVKQAKEEKLNFDKVLNFTALEGVGVRGEIAEVIIDIRKPQKTDEKISEIDSMQKQGKTVVIVEKNKIRVGLIALADTIKDEAVQAVKDLHKRGLETIMLTGDNKLAAKHIADLVGIDEVMAEVLPSEKASKIKELQAKGKVVAMAGDGINDAPALVQADIGIAMATGTDVAIESAGITLLGGDILKVSQAVVLAKATMRTVKQNLFWAFIYNIIGIPIAAGVLYPIWGILLSPIFAGFAMAGSSVSVVSNSLRLKTKKL